MHVPAALVCQSAAPNAAAVVALRSVVRRADPEQEETISGPAVMQCRIGAANEGETPERSGCEP